MEHAKPTIPEVIERFRAYHRMHPTTWGALHIVLSDGNVADSHVESCIRNAQETGDTEGEELARILLRMSQTQRRKLGSEAWTE